MSDHSGLAEPLAKLAGNRHAHIAFAAEVARVARGESNGARAVAIAPMIKEAHRITLCQEVLVSWSWRPALGAGLGAALAALRGAERHLGRWLLLAELGARSGDTRALGEAKREAAEGSAGTQPAWALVTWALAGSSGEPATRPNLELMMRLSDRRDPTPAGYVEKPDGRQGHVVLVSSRRCPGGDSPAPSSPSHAGPARE